MSTSWTMSEASTRRAMAGSSRRSMTRRSGSRNSPRSRSTAPGSPLRAPSSRRSVSSRLGHMSELYEGLPEEGCHRAREPGQLGVAGDHLSAVEQHGFGPGPVNRDRAEEGADDPDDGDAAVEILGDALRDFLLRVVRG